MKVCIAEKPSVAREIAAILGTTSKKDGYMEGNGYAVTWAFGHLIEPAMPEACATTGFRKEDLPILPEEFILVPRQVKARLKKEWGGRVQRKISNKKQKLWILLYLTGTAIMRSVNAW